MVIEPNKDLGRRHAKSLLPPNPNMAKLQNTFWLDKFILETKILYKNPSTRGLGLSGRMIFQILLEKTKQRKTGAVLPVSYSVLTMQPWRYF